jgi:hypothetical protein
MKGFTLFKGRRYILLLIPLALAALFCGINEPVDGDYFNDLDRIKGGEKPTPEPIIDSVTATYDDSSGLYEIEINFDSTFTTDPDTGTADNLRYYIYFSFTDPLEFESESEYYDETRRLGYIDQSDFGTDPKIVYIYTEPLGKRVYFWITAYDGGRESDYSKEHMFVDI